MTSDGHANQLRDECMAACIEEGEFLRLYNRVMNAIDTYDIEQERGMSSELKAAYESLTKIQQLAIAAIILDFERLNKNQKERGDEED